MKSAENKSMLSENNKTNPVDSSLFFKMMFQNAQHTSILVMNTNGDILDANYGLLKSFGYPRESLIGNNFKILFIEEDIQSNLPEREIMEVMQTGSSNDDNYLLQYDGTATWVHGESIYAKTETGKEFIVKVIQDINKEKVLQKELLLINEKQVRIINDRDTFIYTASHDLQAPMNNIEGLVKALKEKTDPEESKMLMGMIDKSIQRFRKKIQELSELGKVQEEAKNKLDTIEFQPIFQEVILDLEEEIRSSEGKIQVDFSKAPLIAFSPRNLKSIIQNLISNSLKYKSPERNLVVNVETKKVNNEYILLSVEDNGIGIRDEDKEKVFRMYQRLHNDSKGTGVGMAIVKRIVDNVGGKIELESNLGHGTTFKIYFPIESISA
jgi:PAS domain S-box-containing protein